jgi:hypothetical protein
MACHFQSRDQLTWNCGVTNVTNNRRAMPLTCTMGHSIAIADLVRYTMRILRGFRHNSIGITLDLITFCPFYRVSLRITYSHKSPVVSLDRPNWFWIRAVYNFGLENTIWCLLLVQSFVLSSLCLINLGITVILTFYFGGDWAWEKFWSIKWSTKVYLWYNEYIKE